MSYYRIRKFLRVFPFSFAWFVRNARLIECRINSAPRLRKTFIVSLFCRNAVKWASESSIALVKGKRELHRYSMQVALPLIKQYQNAPASDMGAVNTTFGYFCKFGRHAPNTACRPAVFHHFEFPSYFLFFFQDSVRQECDTFIRVERIRRIKHFSGSRMLF